MFVTPNWAQVRWMPGTPWPNLETGAGPADHYLPPEHRALWPECPSEEDWNFRHFPVWVRTSWPNPRPRPSVLPKYAERRQLTWPHSADLATKLWGSAEDLYRICVINRTEDLTCTAVDRWRRRRRKRRLGSCSSFVIVVPLTSIFLPRSERLSFSQHSAKQPEVHRFYDWALWSISVCMTETFHANDG